MREESVPDHGASAPILRLRERQVWAQPLPGYWQAATVLRLLQEHEMQVGEAAVSATVAQEACGEAAGAVVACRSLASRSRAAAEEEDAAFAHTHHRHQVEIEAEADEPHALRSSVLGG